MQPSARVGSRRTACMACWAAASWSPSARHSRTSTGVRSAPPSRAPTHLHVLGVDVERVGVPLGVTQLVSEVEEGPGAARTVPGGALQDRQVPGRLRLFSARLGTMLDVEVVALNPPSGGICDGLVHD